MQPHPARKAPEVLVESIRDIDRHRVVQSPAPCRDSAATEISQERLRYARQVNSVPLQAEDRNAASGEGFPECWPVAARGIDACGTASAGRVRGAGAVSAVRGQSRSD